MANRDAPFGLRPAFHLTGGGIRLQEYHIADSLANAIGYGDPVFLVDAVAGREGRDIDAADTVNTDDNIVGVFAGVTYQATNGDQIYRKDWVASTATLNTAGAKAYVWDDPFIVFRVQGDGTSTLGTNGEGAVGLSANIVYAEPDTVSGMSRVELDTSDIGATAQTMYIYDFVRGAENDASLANPEYLVLWNFHAYRNAAAASFDLLAAS